MSASAVVFANEEFLVEEFNPPATATPVEEKDWGDGIVNQLESISRLARDWDSYGGSPMSIFAAYGALDLLSYFGTELAVPEIRPLANGGLQIEWEGPAYEVSLEVAPSRRISVMLAPVDGDPEVDEVGLSLRDVLDRYYERLLELLSGEPAL